MVGRRWLSVVSCWLSVVGHRLSVVGRRSSLVVGCRLVVGLMSVVGCRWWVVGCRLSVDRRSVIGGRVLRAGVVFEALWDPGDE